MKFTQTEKIGFHLSLCYLYMILLWLHFSTQFALRLARLLHLVVLVGLVVLVLHEVVKETRPGLVIVVRRQVGADRLTKVQKHIPSVFLDAPHLRMTLKKSNPTFQDWRLSLGEHQLPEKYGHIGGQSLKADHFLAGKITSFRGHDGGQAESKCKPVEVFEHVRTRVDLSHNLRQPHLHASNGIDFEASESFGELGSSEPAHLK